MKKLIIVCEEKLRHCGDFLAQLMSSTNDETGKLVGILPGAAAAQVWSEKEYSANAAQISSEQYILFIGDSKMIKEKRLHMQKKYSEYGMNYGWLGKQGVLFVDRIITYDEYEEFYKLACQGALRGSQPEVLRLIEKKEDAPQIMEAIDVETITNIKDSIQEAPVQPENENGLKKFFAPIGKGTMAVVKKTTEFGAEKLEKVSNDISVATKRKDIENQEYTCLILQFYLKDLRTFLGMGE